MNSYSPARKGAWLALAAAALFGLSTPLVQHFGQSIGVFTTAGLLYVGAAGVAVWQRQPASREARVRRGDALRLLCMAFFGAVLGPVALAWGLQRTSGTSASLMLTLEAVFTAVLAWRMYGEAMDRRVAAALLFLVAGGGALVFEQGLAGGNQMLGLLAILGATAAWGLDNSLSRGVAERDPGQVVLYKSALGATATLLIALAVAEPLPPWRAGVALLAVGATGYGLSLRLYLLAQRAFGAGRTGSVFGFAPFIGALGAWAMGSRSGTWWLALGAALMLLGVALHLLEGHAHEHVHEGLAHEHAHSHDDGHHLHPHEPVPTQPHNHWHEHPPLQHAHPHVPDAHHLHTHD